VNLARCGDQLRCFNCARWRRWGFGELRLVGRPRRITRRAGIRLRPKPIADLLARARPVAG